MKIVYCLNSISHLGGIAVVTIAKANALAEIDGNQIFVCVSDYSVNELSSRLSPKVTLIDLNINYYKDDWKSKIHVLKGIFLKRRKHQAKLKEVLNRINPDVVVSVGQSEKYMLPRIKGSWKSVRELHFTTNYRRYISTGFLSKTIAKLNNLYDFKWKIRRYDHVVLLTEEDRKVYWNNADNVSVIPNPLTVRSSVASSLEAKTIISVGRLEKEKNFSSLIRAFALVAEKHSDWTLEIYGEGSQKRPLQDLIEHFGLAKNVFLKRPVYSIENELSKASFFVLTSDFEGFGLVIIEAMACGLPVLSYDCPCGPRNIISDGTDGFLIPLGDEQQLAEKMCSMMEHPELRKEMGKAAIDKSKRYSIEHVVCLWMNLFERLVKKERQTGHV